MDNLPKKFLIRTLILSILLVIFYIVSEFIFKFKIFPQIFPYLLLLFLVFYNLSFLLLSRFASRKFQSFLNLNMLLTFGKLVIMMGVVIAYIFFIKTEILKFIITFFILYVIFTSIEVGSIVPEVKKNKAVR